MEQEEESANQTVKKPNRRFHERKKWRRIKVSRQPIPDGTVVNTSKYTPTNSELQLLSKGLQFVPSPSDFSNSDRIELYTDVLEFNRRLHLKLFFQNREDNRPIQQSPFRESSGWTPPVGINTQFERFVNCVTHDALDHTPAPVRPNLTRQQNAAIKSLRDNPDITIKPADNGGAIVI